MLPGHGVVHYQAKETFTRTFSHFMASYIYFNDFVLRDKFRISEVSCTNNQEFGFASTAYQFIIVDPGSWFIGLLLDFLLKNVWIRVTDIVSVIIGIEDATAIDSDIREVLVVD